MNKAGPWSRSFLFYAVTLTEKSSGEYFPHVIHQLLVMHCLTINRAPESARENVFEADGTKLRTTRNLWDRFNVMTSAEVQGYIEGNHFNHQSRDHLQAEGSKELSSINRSITIRKPTKKLTA